MIRFLIIYDEPSDPAGFDEHYHAVHEPLTRRLPGLVAFTVHRRPHSVRGPAYYQVVELTWPDWETAEAELRLPGRKSRRGGRDEPRRAPPQLSLRGSGPALTALLA